MFIISTGNCINDTIGSETVPSLLKRQRILQIKWYKIAHNFVKHCKASENSSMVKGFPPKFFKDLVKVGSFPSSSYDIGFFQVCSFCNLGREMS